MTENSLSNLREALLAAHKALIEDAKRMYVSSGQRAPDPVAFWHLLIRDPFFQWLRPISEAIVALDEGLERAEPLTWAQGVALVREELVDEAGPEFREKLAAALRRDETCRSSWKRVLVIIGSPGVS